MDEKEIILNMKEIDKEYKKDRMFILSSVEKTYSELNHGELIVSTGAFALILNFLIGNGNFAYLWLLHIGMSFLVLVIIVKSLSHRRKAGITEKEIDILDKSVALRSEFYIILHKMSRGIQLSRGEIEYRDNFKKVTSGLKKLASKKMGVALNEIEYYSYLIGIILILGFFVLNTAK